MRHSLLAAISIGALTAMAAFPADTVVLDLATALRRARDYNPQFMQANIAASLAREDRVQAKASLFPAVNALNQYIYTQGNGTPSGTFVANDGVHIYNEQALIHADLFSFAKNAEYRRTIAAEAAARAKVEIASRGLFATVVQNYYALVIARRHEANARRGVEEARRFLEITRQQEKGGEVAHADTVKALLQCQQRQRDLADQEAGIEKARIALAVIVFPDLSQPFTVTDDLRADVPIPPLPDFETLAAGNNPEIRAAEADVRQARAAITEAKAAYLPTLGVDYFFGIDANVLGLRGPDNRKNLGSVVQATVNVPVWNWGATRSRVRQAELQHKQAQFALSTAHRALQSDLAAYYVEAKSAQNQLESLRDSQTLSEESLRLTLLRYEAGEATALEAVDAQTTLVQARNAYDDGLARFRMALASLQTLTGRF